MRISAVFSGFLMIFTLFSVASCSSKPPLPDFMPYMEGQKIKQRSLWDDDQWTAKDWIRQENDAKQVMRDLYEGGIITAQYTDHKNIPILEVGDNFLKLSGLDQRRVLKFVDHVFAMTAQEENGSFYVYYKNDKSEPLGIYNKHSFQNY